MAHDVFLSYRREDKSAADRLCASLESKGIHCWIAPRDIPIGTEWPTAIVEAINICKVFVIILSSNSKNARQISREAELADKQGCQIITFRIEDVEPPAGLTYFLGNIQWLDAFGGQFDNAAAQVAQLIRKAPETRATPSPLPPSPSPPPTPAPAKRSAGLTWLGLASIGAVCVVGLGAWWAAHRSQPPPPPDKDAMLLAKRVADRFLLERESGNVNSAWAEFTPEAQIKTNKSAWLKAQAELRESGRVTNQFNGCTPEGSGFYCDYTLLHSSGPAQDNKIFLIPNQQGGWSISRSELGHPEKSRAE